MQIKQKTPESLQILLSEKKPQSMITFADGFTDETIYKSQGLTGGG